MLGGYFYKEFDVKEIQKRQNVEPTVKYKYSTVASGATPIGSTGRAPDKATKKIDNIVTELLKN
jgi:hypothetical protein